MTHFWPELYLLKFITSLHLHLCWGAKFYYLWWMQMVERKALYYRLTKLWVYLRFIFYIFLVGWDIWLLNECKWLRKTSIIENSQGFSTDYVQELYSLHSLFLGRFSKLFVHSISLPISPDTRLEGDASTPDLPLLGSQSDLTKRCTKEVAQQKH